MEYRNSRWSVHLPLIELGLKTGSQGGLSVSSLSYRLWVQLGLYCMSPETVFYKDSLIFLNSQTSVRL